MTHKREPNRELKVTVTLEEMNNPNARRQHGDLPSVDVMAIRQRTG